LIGGWRCAVALCIGGVGQSWLDVDNRRAIDRLDRLVSRRSNRSRQKTPSRLIQSINGARAFGAALEWTERPSIGYELVKP
jgi:hypothetical protein